VPTGFVLVGQKKEKKIIIQTFVRRTLSASELNLRHHFSF